MSTILDALKKLERDKEVDAAQSRPANPLAPPPAPMLAPGADRRSRAVSWLVVGALLMFGAGIGFGLWTGTEHEAPTVGRDGANAVAARPLARASSPTPPAAPPVERPSVAPAAPSVEQPPVSSAAPSVERSPESLPVAAEPPSAAPRSLAPPASAVAIASLPDVPTEVLAGGPATAAPASAPSPRPSSSVAAESSDQPAAEEGARPGLADVVVESADERREVTVLKTIWHPKPERRSAQIRFESGGEPIEVREVEIVGGYRVEAITPSSVVLVKDGVSMTYRVGR